MHAAAGRSIVKVESSETVAVIRARVEASVSSHGSVGCLARWFQMRVFCDIALAFVVEIIIVVRFGEEIEIFVVVSLILDVHFHKSAVSVRKVG